MRYRTLNGELVPINEWWAAQTRRNRSDLPCPAIRADGMGDTLSHADGKTYDSRSAYERALKDSGHHIVEAGENTGSTPLMDDVPGLEQDLKDAYDQLEARS